MHKTKRKRICTHLGYSSLYIFYNYMYILQQILCRAFFFISFYYFFPCHLHSSLPTEAWLAEALQMRQTLDRSLQKLLSSSSSDSDLLQRVQLLRRTQIEHEVQRAMGKEGAGDTSACGYYKYHPPSHSSLQRENSSRIPGTGSAEQQSRCRGRGKAAQNQG